MRILYCGLILLLMLCAETVLGQIQGVVQDKATGNPVAYANIWVENENLGTTSSEAGAFSFADASAVGKVLVVSCLGYERSLVPITSDQMVIQLQPTAVELQEVTVRPSNGRRKAMAGYLDTSLSSTHYGNGGTPWIVAQYFPYKKTYDTTPFLDEITFVVSCMVKNAKFQIRLLAKDENGEPGNDLLAIPLRATSPKGRKNLIKLDVSQYNLQMPEDGFFIAFEWFIIEENKYTYTYTKTGSKRKYQGVSYEPSIRKYKEGSDTPNAWIYFKGAWHYGHKVKDGKVLMDSAPQFQLTLSD